MVLAGKAAISAFLLFSPRSSESFQSIAPNLKRRIHPLLASHPNPSFHDEKSKKPSKSKKVRTSKKNPFQWSPWPDRKTTEDENATSKWIRWMSSGTPKGYDTVKYRNAVELGGVPRSDRYSTKDWLHNLLNLPQSSVLRDIRGPVLFMTIWGGVISVLYRFLTLRFSLDVAARVSIPTSAHSLAVSALGLLLVFRTNSAYQRFVEGRKIWENILSTSRDLSRFLKLYEVQVGAEKRRRIQRLMAAFPYLLRHRIRPNSVMVRLSDTSISRNEHSLLLYDDTAITDTDYVAASLATDEETTGMSRREPRELYWVDKRTLPWRLLPPNTMEPCARAQNRPLWVADRMAKELCTVPDGPNFTNRERLALLGHVDKLSHAIGACERIHQTVVPLSYARHALRSLTIWLLTLPFALVEQLGLLTGIVLFVISWILFGVYEIGTRIEDPFQGTLRLSILCDGIRRDVLGDELIRETAFKLDNTDKNKTKEEDDPNKDTDEDYEDSPEWDPSTDDNNNVNGATASNPKFNQRSWFVTNTWKDGYG